MSDEERLDQQGRAYAQILRQQAREEAAEEPLEPPPKPEFGHAGQSGVLYARGGLPEDGGGGGGGSGVPGWPSPPGIPSNWGDVADYLDKFLRLRQEPTQDDIEKLEELNRRWDLTHNGPLEVRAKWSLIYARIDRMNREMQG